MSAEAGIHPKSPNRFPIKNVGNDEDDGFPFPAFALARRSATARKREDKLHGNDQYGEQKPYGFPNYGLISIATLHRLLPLPDNPLGNQQPHNDQDNDDDKFSFIGKKIGHHDIHGLDSEGGPPICIDCHGNP